MISTHITVFAGRPRVPPEISQRRQPQEKLHAQIHSDRRAGSGIRFRAGRGLREACRWPRTTTSYRDQPKAVEASKPVETPKAVEDAKPAETPKVETPKYVDRPAAVNTATETTKTDAIQPATMPAPKVARRKPRRDWTEARIIGELHRHGIYW